jgi:hypothetical protein
LREFLEEEGPTPGCTACGDPAHRAHTKRCLGRREQFEAKRRKTTTTELPATEPPTTTTASSSTTLAGPDRPSKREREAETGEEEQIEQEGRVRPEPDEDMQVSLISITGPPWYDGRDGHELDTEAVEAGMAREVASLQKFGVYTEVDESACPAKQLVSSRWVLIEELWSSEGQACSAAAKQGRAL